MLFLHFYQQLWQNARRWAIALTIFIGFQLFFVYKQVDSFPFFLYGMYSGKANLAYDATVFRLHINKGDFSPEARMPMLAQSVLYSNLHFYADLKQQGEAREANLRTVIKDRLSKFVAPADLPNYLPYFEAHLCNPTSVEPDKMRAWLVRFLAPYQVENTGSIEIWQIHLQREGAAFVPIDSFLLL